MSIKSVSNCFRMTSEAEEAYHTVSKGTSDFGLFSLGPDQTQVQVDQVLSKGSTWEDFVAALPQGIIYFLTTIFKTVYVSFVPSHITSTLTIQMLVATQW